jgi:lipoate-protein ligase A
VELLEMMRKSIDFKVKNGKLLRVDFELEDDKIKEIKITGDFFICPEEGILFIENCLKGCKLEDCRERLEETIEKYGIKLVGFSVEDLYKCLIL